MDSRQTDTFHADRPSVLVDLFNRRPFASRVAQTIARRSDPASLVIGIYGAWGEGKTTVLHYIAEELGRHDSIGCIWFNPWKIEGEESLVGAFFDMVADHLEESLLTRSEKAAKWFADKTKLLGGSSTGTGAASGKPTGSAEAFSLVALESLKARLEELLSECGRRIVVLVDDIDRLDRDELHRILRLVKLSGNIDGITYVLAFDPEMVAAALQERYASGTEGSGRSFLEKIVQVPLTVPPADRRALRQLCFEGVEEVLQLAGIALSEVEAKTFANHFARSVEPRLHNPRAAHRYRNALGFALPLLKGEANTVDLLLIEAMKCFYPTLHEAIRRNPQLFLLDDAGVDGAPLEQLRLERLREVINTATTQMLPEESAAAQELVQALFPGTRFEGAAVSAFENSMYAEDWSNQWKQAQRICASTYFDRFFTYALDASDVSDADFSALLEQTKTLDAGSLRTETQRLISRSNADRYVEKLRISSERLDAESAAKLAIALAGMGELFSDEPMFLSVSPMSQAAETVILLLVRVPAGKQRVSLAEQILEDAVPLSFACDCFRYMSSQTSRCGQDKPFTDSELRMVANTAVDRIRREADKDFLRSADLTIGALHIWAEYGSKREINSRLRKWLADNPDNVRLVLPFYASRLPTFGSAEPPRREISDTSYRALAQLLDPKPIAAAIRTVLGAPVQEEEGRSQQTPEEQALVHQFMSLYGKWLPQPCTRQSS